MIVDCCIVVVFPSFPPGVVEGLFHANIPFARCYPPGRRNEMASCTATQPLNDLPVVDIDKQRLHAAIKARCDNVP